MENVHKEECTMYYFNSFQTTEEEELVGPPVPSGYDNKSGHSIDKDNSEDEDDNMEEEEEVHLCEYIHVYVDEWIDR